MGNAETAKAARAEISRNALLKRLARIQLTTEGRDEAIRALLEMECLPPRKTPRRESETAERQSA
jgi:hypothetical protein